MLAVALDALDSVIDLFVVQDQMGILVSLHPSKVFNLSLMILERMGVSRNWMDCGGDWGSISNLHVVRVGSVCLVVPVPEKTKLILILRMLWLVFGVGVGPSVICWSFHRWFDDVLEVGRD